MVQVNDPGRRASCNLAVKCSAVRARRRANDRAIVRTPVSASVSTAPSSHQSPRPLSRTRASNAALRLVGLHVCQRGPFLAPAARGWFDGPSPSNSRWPGTSLSRLPLPGRHPRAPCRTACFRPERVPDADPRLDTRTSDSLALVHAGDATSPSASPAIPGAGNIETGLDRVQLVLAEGFMAALATPSFWNEGPSIMLLACRGRVLVPYALAESNSSARQWTGFQPQPDDGGPSTGS